MSQRDTYDSGAEAEADRTQQKALLAALGAWDRALRRDECGAWCISGKHGRIYTGGDGKTWVMWVGCRSGLHWTHTKKRLDFCTVTQDGDDEGCLRLHALPTACEAAVIRDVLGIRKRMELAPDDLERRKTSMTRLALARILGSAGSPAPEPTPEPAQILDAEPAPTSTNPTTEPSERSRSGWGHEGETDTARLATAP